MDIQKKRIKAGGIKYCILQNGKEVARAYLYLLRNDLHDKPFGLMEDVHVCKSTRGQGYGKKLVKTIIKEARRKGCYKLICTCRHTRPRVQKLYEGIGFKNHGTEYRIDL